MIKIVQKGHFDKTIRFLGFLYKRDFIKNLNEYAKEGVEALSSNTPVDSGKTAASWYYRIKTSPNRIRIEWCNSNAAGNTPVAILIQYGHATRDGYYVEGKDFINPAIEPVFNNIAKRIWSEVTSA